MSELLTDSMHKSPCFEPNRFSASQEIPHILWDPEGSLPIHKSPPPVPILRQLDPVHTPTSHFPKTHLNIIPLSPLRATCPAHLILLDFIT